MYAIIANKLRWCSTVVLLSYNGRLTLAIRLPYSKAASDFLSFLPATAQRRIIRAAITDPWRPGFHCDTTETKLPATLYSTKRLLTRRSTHLYHHRHSCSNRVDRYRRKLLRSPTHRSEQSRFASNSQAARSRCACRIDTGWFTPAGRTA